MKSKCILGGAKLKLFIHENNGWQQSLQVHKHEIPQMKKLLAEAIKDEQITEEQKLPATTHFNTELMTQEKEIGKLTNDLEAQQQRLTKDWEGNIQYDIDSFCTQDILRDRIKAIEKSYIDLKCNFMNYLATIA